MRTPSILTFIDFSYSNSASRLSCVKLIFLCAAFAGQRGHGREQKGVRQAVVWTLARSREQKEFADRCKELRKQSSCCVTSNTEGDVWADWQLGGAPRMGCKAFQLEQRVCSLAAVIAKLGQHPNTLPPPFTRNRAKLCTV